MKHVALGLIIAASILLSGCNSAQSETIKINGNLEETIEVYSDYTDKGVTYPKDKYEIIVDGKVNNEKIGRYEIKYSFYTKDGELKKELHRFVNVVDTTAPKCEMLKDKVYYMGIEYKPSDFFNYNDNYNSEKELLITPSAYTFKKAIEETVSMVIEDESHNKTTVSFKVKPVFDIAKLASYVGAQASSSVDDNNPYTRITISTMSGASQYLVYYHDARTLHYSINGYSTLSRANNYTVQISAELGGFKNANLTYHVSGEYSQYAAGFATIDATKTEGSISSFKSMTGQFTVDTDAMVSECNQNLPSALRLFHKYMEETLHIDIY